MKWTVVANSCHKSALNANICAHMRGWSLLLLSSTQMMFVTMVSKQMSTALTTGQHFYIKGISLCSKGSTQNIIPQHDLRCTRSSIIVYIYIYIIVEKSPNSSHMYDHGFVDNTNSQTVCKSQKKSFKWFTNSRRISLKNIKTHHNQSKRPVTL